jgi:anti-sigma28 factor (negative regulator of flagellin synthesis)
MEQLRKNLRSSVLFQSTTAEDSAVKTTAQKRRSRLLAFIDPRKPIASNNVVPITNTQNDDGSQTPQIYNESKAQTIKSKIEPTNLSSIRLSIYLLEKYAWFG